MEMDLLSLKLIVLAISGVIRIFFGLIPLIVIRTIRNNSSEKHGGKIIKYVISLLMFFGGGVLLATCFLHMMPEVRSSFAALELKSELPVPELIFIAGFFLVYLLEETVHAIIHRRRRHKHKKVESAAGTAKLEEKFHPVTVSPGGTSKNVVTDGVNGNGIREMYKNGGQVGPNTFIPRIRSPSSSVTGLSYNEKNLADPNFVYIDEDWWKDTLHGNSSVNLVSGSAPTLTEIPLNNNKGKIYVERKGHSSDEDSISEKSDEESHSHIPIGNDEDESVAGAIRNLLIVIAISFHGVFEGLAIGLQGTEKDVWALFLAVSLHECTILFCIGVELISASTKVVRMITYITVVSLVSPLGIAIGIIISENSVAGSSAHTLLVGSLQGLAAGTLLYVTFFEIFAAEGRKLHRKFIHILVAIVGFVMMTSLEFVGSHGHAHGGGHGKSNMLSPAFQNFTTSQQQDDQLLGFHDHDHDHDDDHDLHPHHHH